ncbi:esterase [soil metagenome]
MESHSLAVTRTASYYTLGQPAAGAQSLWIVLHGYGQLAPYFLRNFQLLDDGLHYVVAPEALSRFYLSGVSGRVGATWMTRENRLAEIADYGGYLDKLYRELQEQAGGSFGRVNVLGFSQGGATACRWLTQSGLRIDRLILWAAAFPEDLPFALTREALRDTEVVLVYGTPDEYATEERIHPQPALLQPQEIPYRLIRFEGKHVIEEEVLRSLLR